MGFILLADSFLVAWTVFAITPKILGNTPLGRFSSVIGSILSFFLYLFILAYYNENGSSMLIGMILFFGPIALFLILLLLAYTFNESSDEPSNKK